MRIDVLIGLNQNVAADGYIFHVQTEDVPERGELVTQVFLEGRVLHTYSHAYGGWKARDDWRDRVAAQARRQHTVMVAAIMRGRLTPRAGNP